MSLPVVPARRLGRRGAVTRAAAGVGVLGLRVVMRMPTVLLRAGLWIAKRGQRLFGAVETPEIDDLAQILRDDPEATRVLRRMILESPPAQLRGLVAGVLRHQLGGRPYAVVVPERRGRPTTHVVSGEVRVGILDGDGHGDGHGNGNGNGNENGNGDGHGHGSGDRHGHGEGHGVAGGSGSAEARALFAAYENIPACSVEWVKGEIPAGLHAMEITAGPDAVSRAEAALDLGVAVSIACSLVGSTPELERLFAAADRGAAAVRVFYPYLYYPPVQRLRELVASDELGDLSSLRVRATLGAGAAAPGDDFWSHPAFDHFLSLVALGGDATSACAYANIMTARGGQALLACRFAAPARYGLLELSFAPQLVLPGGPEPFDLEVELAGTHGIAWLRRGMAQRTLGPPLEVRVGQRAYTLGVEAGLRAEWGPVYRHAAEDLIDTLRQGEQPRLTRAEQLAAFRLRDAAREALGRPGVHEI